MLKTTSRVTVYIRTKIRS